MKSLCVLMYDDIFCHPTMDPNVDNPLWMLVKIYRFLKDSDLQDY